MREINWNGRLPMGWADDLIQVYAHGSKDRALSILHGLVRRGECSVDTFIGIVDEFVRSDTAKTIERLKDLEAKAEEFCPNCGSDEIGGEDGHGADGNPVVFHACSICNNTWESDA